MVYVVTTITVMVAVILPCYLFYKLKRGSNFERALKELESEPYTYSADEAIETFEKNFKRKVTWEEKYIIFVAFNKGFVKGAEIGANKAMDDFLQVLKNKKTNKGD